MSISEKILLVDDDETFREEFAESFSEYEIVHASNGEEALAILKRPNEIDLVILDVRMPGMGGLTVLDRIKEIAPDVGAIILTGYSSKDTAIGALRGKADDYIEKPFDIDKTRAIVERILSAKKDAYRQESADVGDKIEHVKRFLRRNRFRKVTLQDAAATVCLSPKYLSRVFQEQAGVSFNEFRIALKMEEAKDLLGRTHYNIDQISEKLGYQNTESFIRQFKKVVGQAPSAFRRRPGERAQEAG
ncbi:MAG: response regulator [Elusimicrobiota bacterium]